MSEAPHRVRTGSAAVAVSAATVLLLGWGAHDAAAQRPGETRLEGAAPTWRAGFEVGRVPSLRLGWEALRDGWTFGAATGVGPGSDGVVARLTPSIRVGRRLPVGFRVDAGLGFELARLDEAGNTNESEIQWEVTGGWSGPSGWGGEIGIRRTDYGRAYWEPLVRLSAPGSLLGAPLRMATLPERERHPFGSPRPVAAAGSLDLAVRAPHRSGSGVLLAASNPRGDPNPWRDPSGPNVDRLGVRAEAWAERGRLAAWGRWSSDLHTDPSIAARVARVAEGAGFPVTVSFSGGATWSDPAPGTRASVGARLDPKVFLWMPHLGEERTARVRALSARARVGPLEVSAIGGALDAIEGRTVQPLEHARLAARSLGRWSVGIEHERVSRGGQGLGPQPDPRRRSATRVSLSRRGALRARVAFGSDVVLRVAVGRSVARSQDASTSGAGASPWAAASPWGHAPESLPRGMDPANNSGPGGFWAGADLEVRTAPALLDYEALLGRGWMVSQEAGRGDIERPLAVACVSAGWGPVGLEAAAGRGLPLWTEASTRRVDGGRVDAVWAGGLDLVPGRGHVRLRLAEWGPAPAWWREEATLEGRLRVPLQIRGSGELAIEMYGRSALESARRELHQRGGVEATLTLALPLPMGRLGTSGRAEARLEDVFDRGLPTRLGGPARGRRLTVLVLWEHGE